MSLAVELGIVVESVLYCASHDVCAVDVSVGFRHYPTVDAARFVLGGGAVVLGCLGYDLDLLVVKETAQGGILANHPAGCNMVVFTSFGQTDVVAGGSGVDHLDVDLGVEAGEGKTLLYHGSGMLLVMGAVEVRVLRNDIAFDVRNQAVTDVVLFHKCCKSTFFY